MPFGVAVPIAAAAIGAGASIYGASKQSKAVSKGAEQAADAQLQGQREALEFQRQALDQMRGDLQPYRDAGQTGLSSTLDASGAAGPEGYARAMAAFQASPGYQFQFDEGMRATGNQFAAQGMNNSGAVLKALQARGQGLANQDFGQYYSRLAGLAQMGQNSSAMTGSAAMTAGNNLASGAMQTGANLGNIYASQGTAQANIQGNMVSGVSGAINSGLNNYMYLNRPGNSLYNPSAAGGVGTF